MSAKDRRQKDLEDLQLKLRDARRAAAAPDASERDQADLKLIEQQVRAAEQKLRHAGNAARHEADGAGRDKVEEKLDTALEQSFPGSDPVAAAEPAPRTKAPKKSG